MKPHGNSKLTTKGDHLPPEVAEMADNLAPARTVPTKRGGGATGFPSMPDVEEPARFVCQVPSVC